MNCGNFKAFGPLETLKWSLPIAIADNCYFGVWPVFVNGIPSCEGLPVLVWLRDNQNAKICTALSDHGLKIVSSIDKIAYLN